MTTPSPTPAQSAAVEVMAIRGVVVVATDSDGRVIAHAADFERQGYGGFSLAEAQTVRARQRARWNAVRAYMSDKLADALDSYALERVWDQMSSKGWKMTVIPVSQGAPRDGETTRGTTGKEGV